MSTTLCESLACGDMLHQRGNIWPSDAGYSFHIARQGFVNLPPV